MRKPHEFPIEDIAEYWQLVRDVLTAGGMSKKEAAEVARAYREYMKPAGWAFYNRDPEDAAAYAIKYAAWTRKQQEGEAVALKPVKRRPVQLAKTADSVPTEKEVAQLPRWARVAFAARCARRLIPQFQKFWPDTPTSNVDSLRFAIVITENHAATADRDHDAEDSRVQDMTLSVAYAATRANRVEAVSIAYSAADAVDAARAAASNADVGVRAAAARVASNLWSKPFARGDYAQVRALSWHHKWTDDTPVPPAVFGPLWPEGPPADWPELPKPTKLKLSVQVPDNLDDVAVREKLQTLMAALARLNVAGGGHGLELIRPIDFTQEQERGRADAVKQEAKKPKGRGHAQGGR